MLNVVFAGRISALHKKVAWVASDDVQGCELLHAHVSIGDAKACFKCFIEEGKAHPITVDREFVLAAGSGDKTMTLKLTKPKGPVLYESTQTITVEDTGVADTVIEVKENFPKTLTPHGETELLCDIAVKSNRPVKIKAEVLAKNAVKEISVWSTVNSLEVNGTANIKARVDPADLPTDATYRVVIRQGKEILYSSKKPSMISIRPPKDAASRICVTPSVEETVNPNAGYDVEIGQLRFDNPTKTRNLAVTLLLDGKEVLTATHRAPKGDSVFRLVVDRNSLLFGEDSTHTLSYSVVDESAALVARGNASLRIPSFRRFDCGNTGVLAKRFSTTRQPRMLVREALGYKLTGYQHEGQNLVSELKSVHDEGFAPRKFVYQTAPFSPGICQEAKCADETWISGSGNCLDFSIFKSAVYSMMGLQTALLELDGHILPAVVIPDEVAEKNLRKVPTIKYGGIRMIPIESTIDDFDRAVKEGVAETKSGILGMIRLYEMDEVPYYFPVNA